MRETKKNQPEVVVSMTSFPGAISYAVKAVRSILDGSVLPDRLVLYLTLSDFGEKGLPDELSRLVEENDIFEIRDHAPDLRSYMKLVPALHDFPDAVIVTVDDDVDYYRHTLKRLLKWHRKYPDAVIAHRTRRIMPGCAYREWKRYKWYHFLYQKVDPGFGILQTGVGGALYPPRSLRMDMIDPELFQRLAPTTDDIWFWAAAVANGTKIFPVPFGYYKPRDLPKPKQLALKTRNFRGEEDLNLRALNAIMENYPDVAQKLEQSCKR